jgi:predicted Zn-dependent protease
MLFTRPREPGNIPVAPILVAQDQSEPDDTGWSPPVPRELNLLFGLGLVIVVAVLGGTIHFVHAYQVRRYASVLLDRARRAEADEDLEKATESLRQYLDLNREDGPTWAWYARLVDRRTPAGPGRVRAYLVHEEALRHHPADPPLQRRCAELALELERYSDARRYLQLLHQRAPRDSYGAPADAELEDLLGQCDRGEGGEAGYAEAERWFRQAVAHDPGHIASYDHRARMLRKDLQQPEEADRVIEAMVKVNPRSARAYLARWHYRRDFRLAPDARDLQQALQLGPEDPDVLLAAASFREQRGDLAAAREHLQKGLKLAPGNTAFLIGLAQLDLRDGHPDRTETALRHAIAANPKSELSYALAEALISQGKIDGKDQAEELVGRLRTISMREGYLQHLEARILVHRQEWSKAIAKIQTARSHLAADPARMANLNVMLAECYGRLGLEEQRLAALEQAADDETAGAAVGPALAEGLARAGKLDEAMEIHRRLVERRPESQLDLARLAIQKTLRQPREQRDWREVERQLQEAEAALPQQTAELTLLRAELLAAQGHPDEARTLVDAARTKEPRNLRYRLALAQIARGRGDAARAVQILEQAERDLGPSLALRLARLSAWVGRGGAEARAALAELARTHTQLAPADQQAFLEPLARAAHRLGELPLARQSLLDLLVLKPDHLGAMIVLFDLALEADDPAEAVEVLDKIRRVEGEDGTLWRYGQAVGLINRARRGDTQALGLAQTLVSEILARRGDYWWGGPLLRGEIAELNGDLGSAAADYRRAFELGNSQPALVRRLVGLLDQRQEFDQIDRVVQTLQDRGVAPQNLTAITAITAIRKKDFARGIPLARQAFPETSPRATDHLARGRLLLAAGQQEEAGKTLRRAVELGPGLPDAWLALVQYLVGTKQMDQAKAALEAARKALPADRAAPTLAQCLALVGDSQQAEALFQAALVAQPDDLATLRAAARFFVDRRQWDQAQPLLTKLVDPKIGASAADKAWANRTRIVMLLSTRRRADQDQALQLADRNLENNPSSVEDKALKAVILAQRPDRRGEAIAILEELAGAQRLGADQRFLLAHLYLGQGDEEKYRVEMLKLLDLRVRSPQHLAHFISYWISRNELDQAERWLAELKQAEPKGLAALELEARLLDLRRRKPELKALLEARGREVPDQIGPVADLLHRYGFVPEAEAAYKAFVARDSRQPERTLALAQFLARHDRPAEAMELLKKAWSTCRHELVATIALVVYGAPSADESQRRQAEAWIAEAVQQRPDAVELGTKLSRIWIHAGRSEEAEDLCRRLLRSHPDNVEALNNLAWILALRQPSQTNEALGLIDYALEIKGPVPTLVDTRAVVLIRAGQIEKAIPILEEAQQRNPGNASLARHLAWAYQQQGNADQARKALHDAEALGEKASKCDPLEQPFLDKLRQDLSGTQPQG